jgi:hypothetical protein
MQSGTVLSCVVTARLRIAVSVPEMRSFERRLYSLVLFRIQLREYFVSDRFLRSFPHPFSLFCQLKGAVGVTIREQMTMLTWEVSAAGGMADRLPCLVEASTQILIRTAVNGL